MTWLPGCPLFADDTALYRLIATTDDHAVLQFDLQKLEVEQWEEDWDMNYEVSPWYWQMLRPTSQQE